MTNKKEKKVKKKRSNKSSISFKIFSIVILGLILVFVFQFNIILGHAGRWVGRDAKLLSRIDKDHVLGFKNAVKFSIVDNNIFKWGSDKLCCYGIDGKEIWEKPINGEDMEICGGNSTIAITDPKMGDIFLLDKNGHIKAKVFGLGKIDKMAYGAKDELACYFPDKKKVTIFDKNLIPSANIPVSDGMLMDISISKKADLIALTFFRLSNEGYHSQIFTYRKNGRAIGAINIKGEVLLDISATDDRLIGVTDTNIFAYSPNNELLWEKEVDRTIKKASISPSTGLIVLNLIRAKEDLADTRPTNVLLQIDKDGVTLNDVEISYDIDELKLSGMKTVFSSDHKIYILSQNGHLDSIFKLKQPIETFSILKNFNLGIEYADHLDIIELGK